MKNTMQGRARRACAGVLLLAQMLVAGWVGAQTPTPPSQPSQPSQPTPPSPPASAASGASGAAARAPAPVAVPDPTEPKPFDKVITADFKTQEGLLRVHQHKGKLYFEIPKAVLDQPLLMVANATAVPSGLEHVGRTLNQDVLRFVLRQNRVMLQLISHDAVTAPGSALADAVRLSQRDAILAVFQVEAFGKDGAPVIEVTRLFSTEVGDFSARALVRGGLDGSRSYVEQAKAFPGSVRVDAVQTYSVAPMPVPVVPGMPVVPQIQPARSASFNVAYSLVQLPAEPMRPRLLDDRVGFFSIARSDFGAGAREVRRERLITRWRLDKKDPAAAVSEPVKPIVWYIDKATPPALVPFVKRGVEAWNAAFEQAGFKNAVQARPFPTAEEDPEFDPEDVRYSVIRWVPSSTPNAYGPHLADPRSGEILNANIVMFHNIVQLQRDWYVTQVGPLDPRARQLPLPDDLMGELVAFVVTHEVGHSLGFPHNMKSSSLYPVNKLRDPQWLQTMGHVPSVMDYSRFNYLVQPEDKIDPALLIPKLGPYDFFATRWGYTPIPSAQTPEEERQQLNLWAREQDSKPWLRFSVPKAEGGDFGDNTEAVGDADAVTATGLGLRNLQRVVKMLPGLTPPDGGDDKTLEDLYRATWTQWRRELGHVAAVVGGYEVQNKHNDQPGAIATPVPRAQQARAVKFLLEQGLGPQQWLLDPAVTQRLRASEPHAWVMASQRTVLRQLLDPARGARLSAQRAQLGAQAYGTDDLLADLNRAVMGESPAAATPQRRTLQRLYVETLVLRLSLPSVDDGQAAVRAELREVQATAARRASQGDRTQRAHWLELKDTIDRALDPRAAAANPLALLLRMFGAQDGDGADAHSHAHTHAQTACWPAHALSPSLNP